MTTEYIVKHERIDGKQPFDRFEFDASHIEMTDRRKKGKDFIGQNAEEFFVSAPMTFGAENRIYYPKFRTSVAGSLLDTLYYDIETKKIILLSVPAKYESGYEEINEFITKFKKDLADSFKWPEEE